MSEIMQSDRPRPRVIRGETPRTQQKNPAEILRMDDAELARHLTAPESNKLVALYAQMNTLAQDLLVRAPTSLQPEWLIQPARYRQFVLGVLPHGSEAHTTETEAWIKDFSRLVALDIRAQQLGNIQDEESALWHAAIRDDATQKAQDLEGRLAHVRVINARASALFEEWKLLATEERVARQRQAAIERSLKKFTLIRTRTAYRSKPYSTEEEALADVRLLDAMGDDVLVLNRFLLLAETARKPEATPPAAQGNDFADEEPTELRTSPSHKTQETATPRKSFLRRVFSPFAAAALFMLGLESAQDHDSPHMPAATPENPTHETVRPEPVAIQTPAPSPEAAPAPAQNGPTMEDFHTVQKGERLWDIARQEIASERNIAPKRVHNQDILDRVKALEILNDIQNPKKLEIGERLNLRVPEPKMETPAPEPRTAHLASPRTTIESTASTSEAPHASTVTASAKITRTAEPSANALPSAEKPHVIKSRGDTAWAHAQTLLQDGGVRPTTARRRLLAALMLEDSGKLNAYRLKIGQQLTTTRAEEAVAQLRAGKNPADIARSMGITWPVKGL